MRFKEFKPLQEGGASGGTRFNTEVGMLAGFCGIDISQFDPANPAIAFANTNLLANPQTVFADIKKFLAPVYDAGKFAAWYRLGVDYKARIDAELGKLGLPAISQFDWQGGTNINAEGAADILFVGNEAVQGVSIKDKSGITLANLTVKSLGLGAPEGEEGDADAFQYEARDDYLALKRYVFEQVLNLAMATPGKPVVPIKPKYRIVYNVSQQPTTTAQPATLTPGQTNRKLPPGAEKIPMGQEPTVPVNEQADGIFTCIWDDTREFKGTYDQIMALIVKNADWQRVFGDWMQKNWSSDATLNQQGKSLFAKIAQTFITKIQNTLANKENLQKVLRMGQMAYFYATPKSLYFVPSVDQLQGLSLQSLDYSSPKGTAQYFLAKIGYQGGTAPTEILIYIRYANGIFATNPTVRVQKLVNPEGIAWTKLR